MQAFKPATRPIGKPAWARRPATTPQMLKIEPIEMSIWRQRMTSVIPTAATSTGALRTTNAAKLVGAEEARCRDRPGGQQDDSESDGHRELAPVSARS